MNLTVLALVVTLLSILSQEAGAQNLVIIEYGAVRLAKENDLFRCADAQNGESLKLLTI